MDRIAWDKLLKQGIFAALFIALLIYTVNESKAREQEYQRTIREVTEINSKYADIIKVDLVEIKARLQ